MADGERIKGMLAEMGYLFTDTVESADLVLYNTCAVREHAEDRVFGNVGALEKSKGRPARHGRRPVRLHDAAAPRGGENPQELPVCRSCIRYTCDSSPAGASIPDPLR